MQQETVVMGDITIITGVNGSGKSEVLKKTYWNLFSQGVPVVFVESTDIVIKLFCYIKTMAVLINQARLTNDQLPHWITDLVVRLSVPAVDGPSNEVVSMIEGIIGGVWKYNNYFDEIRFTNAEGSMPQNHVSGGSKTFGIIQLLLQNDNLKPGNVLILDVPETNLHPNWQVKYAEVIVALAKQGIKVMLSSNSPYLIEALVKYARSRGVSSVRLYWMEKQNPIEVTNDIGRIFESLSEPFEIFDELDVECL